MPKRRTWLWVVAIVLVFFVGDVFGRWTMGAFNASPSTSAPRTVQVVAPVAQQDPAPLPVTSKTLEDAFFNNPFAAKATYNGKVANVSGVVLSIGARFDGTPYVQFISDGDLVNLYCNFSPSQENDLAKLQDAQQVTLQGKIKVTSSNAEINACTVIRAGAVHASGTSSLLDQLSNSGQ